MINQHIFFPSLQSCKFAKESQLYPIHCSNTSHCFLLFFSIPFINNHFVLYIIKTPGDEFNHHKVTTQVTLPEVLFNFMFFLSSFFPFFSPPVNINSSCFSSHPLCYACPPLSAKFLVNARFLLIFSGEKYELPSHQKLLSTGLFLILHKFIMIHT